ncbi:MAG: metal ABC transporter permease [Lentisphaeria bacterium]|nr:metal ABC transporter permease [Lentisphaeria bacterium]
MDYEFMRLALLGLLIIAPMAAICGTQVVNFNMSFFSDAIGHSAFAGVATGLVLAISPDYTMPALALCVGLGIMAVKHRSGLSSDTVIGVMFSTVVAGGLAIVSRYPNAVSNAQMFLYGDILTISERDILLMMGLAVVFMLFQIFSFNKLICIELNPQLAKAHRIKVGVYQYFFAALLSLVVIFSVKAVGVLLVTAMLITPAAAARNLASSYGKMLWLSVIIGVFSAIAGLFLSAQDWMQTSTGATIVLCSCVIFAISLIFRKKKRA